MTVSLEEFTDDFTPDERAPVKARLGLDGERSWVTISEANVFTWRDRFLAADREQKAALAARTEWYSGALGASGSGVVGLEVDFSKVLRLMLAARSGIVRHFPGWFAGDLYLCKSGSY